MLKNNLLLWWCHQNRPFLSLNAFTALQKWQGHTALSHQSSTDGKSWSWCILWLFLTKVGMKFMSEINFMGQKLKWCLTSSEMEPFSYVVPRVRILSVALQKWIFSLSSKTSSSGGFWSFGCELLKNKTATWFQSWLFWSRFNAAITSAVY